MSVADPAGVAQPAPTAGLGRAWLFARKALTGNAGAVAIGMGGAAILRFGSNIILTRMLLPEAFGVMLVIWSLSAIMGQLTDTGVSPFVVRSEKGATPRYLGTLWSVSAARGLILAGLLFAAAPAITLLLGKPEVTGPLRAASLIFAIDGLRSMAPFVGIRHQNEAKNAWVTLGGYALSIPVTIGLVWLLDSYWGLVWGAVAASVITTSATYLFYRNAWQRPRFEGAVIKELWAFAAFIFASSITSLVVAQFDRFFVIASLPLAVTGVYAIAINLAVVPDQFAWSYYGKVYMPVIAQRLREGPVTAAVFYRPMRLMRPLLVFVCAGGVTAGAAVVSLIFPPQYDQAGAFLAVLVIKPLLVMISLPTGMLLVANNMARTRFTGDLLRMGTLVVGAMIGWQFFGLWGLLGAVAICEVPPLLYQYWRVSQLGAFDWRQEVPVAAALLAGLGAGAAASWIVSPLL